MTPSARLATFAVLTAACSRNPAGANCGMAALTQPLAVKQSFAEGNVLTAMPDSAPATIPVRLVAGPAWRGTIDRGTTGWRVTVHGTMSSRIHVGYGVLVIDFHDTAIGVLAFEGNAVAGAPPLGTLAIGDSVLPLLGVRMDPAQLQDAACPLFPDSLR